MSIEINYMIPKVTETKKIEIEAVPLSQKVLENIGILDNILTKVEYFVLKILRQFKHPYTTKEIINF